MAHEILDIKYRIPPELSNLGYGKNNDLLYNKIKYILFKKFENNVFN